MQDFIFDLSLVLVAAALLSYFTVILKQPIIISYILCGIIIGPWGFGLVKHVEFIETISHLGITLLLFLAGLCLHPQKLLSLFKKTTLVAFINCVVSFIIALLFCLAIKLSLKDSLCVGLAMMFSSTILTIKLLPTTRLHQERMGAICIGILLLEDLLAVAVLALIRCLDLPGLVVSNFAILLVKLVFFVSILILFEQFVLRKVMRHVDRLHEALFVLGLGWCFGMAMISYKMGLFYETGAFFAGVVLARHKISLFISESLKPLREFFLVLFFFSLGTKLDIFAIKDIWLYSLSLAIIFILIKPILFKGMFVRVGEKKPFAEELGFRLGNLSEFSLLIGILALNLNHIGNKAFQIIQLTTIFTFIISSYIVVFRYPTPIGVDKKMIRD